MASSTAGASASNGATCSNDKKNVRMSIRGLLNLCSKYTAKFIDIECSDKQAVDTYKNYMDKCHGCPYSQTSWKIMCGSSNTILETVKTPENLDMTALSSLFYCIFSVKKDGRDPTELLKKVEALVVVVNEVLSNVSSVEDANKFKEIHHRLSDMIQEAGKFYTLSLSEIHDLEQKLELEIRVQEVMVYVIQDFSSISPQKFQVRWPELRAALEVAGVTSGRAWQSLLLRSPDVTELAKHAAKITIDETDEWHLHSANDVVAVALTLPHEQPRLIDIKMSPAVLGAERASWQEITRRHKGQLQLDLSAGFQKEASGSSPETENRPEAFDDLLEDLNGSRCQLTRLIGRISTTAGVSAVASVSTAATTDLRISLIAPLNLDALQGKYKNLLVEIKPLDGSWAAAASAQRLPAQPPSQLLLIGTKPGSCEAIAIAVRTITPPGKRLGNISLVNCGLGEDEINQLLVQLHNDGIRSADGGHTRFTRSGDGDVTLCLADDLPDGTWPTGAAAQDVSQSQSSNATQADPMPLLDESAGTQVAAQSQSSSAAQAHPPPLLDAGAAPQVVAQSQSSSAAQAHPPLLLGAGAAPQVVAQSQSSNAAQAHPPLLLDAGASARRWRNECLRLPQESLVTMFVAVSSLVEEKHFVVTESRDLEAVALMLPHVSDKSVLVKTSPSALRSPMWQQIAQQHQGQFFIHLLNINFVFQPCDDVLQPLLSNRCRIKGFQGCMQTAAGISALASVCGLAPPAYVHIQLEAPLDLSPLLGKCDKLCVYTPVVDTVRATMHLPDQPVPQLVVLGAPAGSWKAVAQTVLMYAPRGKRRFESLHLKNSGLSADERRRLLRLLHVKRVKTGDSGATRGEMLGDGDICLHIGSCPPRTDAEACISCTDYI
ncbi:uncharacterized protein LOC108671247 [Hyalella azteca]|uniref:Uncharacterized protein LOC108671247 n=1 Tax=Hyalella azteca TaxID=294128 RepID=A0A8B7NKP9_HYAAZ|nr:uncharacterized protein LOC108671247 [Hyalella azteca]